MFDIKCHGFAGIKRFKFDQRIPFVSGAFGIPSSCSATTIHANNINQKKPWQKKACQYWPTIQMNSVFSSRLHVIILN